MADYHSLPQTMIFITDKPEQGCIYMRDQLIHNELFPLQTVVLKGHIPKLYVILKRNVTIESNLMGNDEVQNETKH